MHTARKTLLSLGLLSALTGCGDKATQQTHTQENAESAITEKAAKEHSATVISTPAQLKAEEEKLQARMDNYHIPANTRISLWADETQTQDSGYLSFDATGRMYITEISRPFRGVLDIRGYPEMTAEDIMLESTEERLKMYQKHTDRHPMSFYSEYSDRLRLLEDRDGDGRAERSTIFAGDFNEPLDGLAAGVIERDGNIYFTNIPHLWLLNDTNGDDVADKRTSLQDGFGVRASIYGHDMHGLIWGPDGKLYWSIGDRGYSITTKEGKTFHGPNRGAVFRADPDGSNIELFYHQLRNPQELAFDKFGNLFTADNDGDGGDIERIDYLIEGGDSGWHAGHQSIMSFTTRLNLRSYKYTDDAKVPNSWMVQDMWKPRNDKQPAYLLPAIGQVNGGPSGLVYNPSESFGTEWADNFFVVLYKGAPEKTFIEAFKTQPNGAGFDMVGNREFLRGFNAIDADFGPDGRMYIAEYNYAGWGPQNTGAVYALEYTGDKNQAFIDENKVLLTADYSKKSIDELTALLSRNHQQIRQKAQFELAKRGTDGLIVFTELAGNKDAPLLARVHGIWGLGQMKYETNMGLEILDILKNLLQHDKEDQIRIQSARVLGDHKVAEAAPLFVNALNDSHSQVAMYAAIGIGRLGYSDAAPAIIEEIKANGDQDLFLRHAHIMALSGMSKSAWASYKNDGSKHVRMAVALTMRRHSDPEIAHFLNDKEQAIVDEAIAAINDLQITAARKAGAKTLARFAKASKDQLPTDPIARYMHHRIINMNFDEGDLASAERILAYASNPHLHTRLASEALAAIEGWNDLNPIDTTTGLPAKPNKDRADIKPLIKQYLPGVLKVANGQAMVQAMRIADANGYDIDSAVLLSTAKNSSNPHFIRTQALDTLQKRGEQGLATLASTLLTDTQSKVRAKALSVLMHSDKKAGLSAALKMAKGNNTADQQAALTLLATANNASIDQLLLQQLTQLNSGQFNAGAILELIDAAAASKNSQVAEQLATYQASIAKADVMKQFEGALNGGDIESGKVIFETSGAAQCMRCHIVNRKGGKVGPKLDHIGTHTREYLLAALIDPGADIAPGYGSISIVKADGSKVSGIYMGEDDTQLKLKLPGDVEESFTKADLKEINRPISGMPPMNHMLTPYELRDLVEYLASLKPKGHKGGH